MPGFEVTNYTEFPITVSLEQVGALYWDVVYPGQTFVRDTGAVWFTVKAQLSPDGKSRVDLWRDAVIPAAELTASVLGAMFTGGSTAYGAAAAKGLSWVAVKQATKAAVIAGVKEAAKETLVFGFESVTGLPNPDPSSLKSVGFAVDPVGKLKAYGAYLGMDDGGDVVEDKGEYAGLSGRQRYWVTGGPKVYLHSDPVEGPGLIFSTSPLDITRTRPGVRELARDGLTIKRTATSKSFIYLMGQWCEIQHEVLGVIRGRRWSWVIEMSEDEIRTDIGEMKYGAPISPNIRDGSIIKGSQYGYYLIYDGLILPLPPGRQYAQAIVVPDRLIACLRCISDGTLITQEAALEVYFIARGTRCKVGYRTPFPADTEFHPTMWHMPIVQEAIVKRIFAQVADAAQALAGGLKGRHIQLTPEFLSLVPAGPDLPAGLKDGVVLGGDGGKKYLLVGGRRVEYRGQYRPDEFFNLPDVIESVPLMTGEAFAATLEADGVSISAEISQKLLALQQPIRELVSYDPATRTYGDVVDAPADPSAPPPPSSPGFLSGGEPTFDPVCYTGKYERRPIENDWHVGEISFDANRKLRWTNRAGVSWSIETPTAYAPDMAPWQHMVNSLKLGDENPYRNANEGDQFRFVKAGDHFLGFWFQREFYTYARESQPELPVIHREQFGPRVFRGFAANPPSAEKLPYRHSVVFPKDRPNNVLPLPWGVSSVVVLSDWWDKRPKSIRVLDNGNSLLGQKTFPTRDMMCCGDSGTEACSVDRPVSKLVVPLDGIRWVDQLAVEIDAPLGGDSEMVILSGIEIRGHDKLCFLSSACMRARGLPENCEELNVLRGFRDTWLVNQPGGADAIREYYAVAPGIVSAIDARPDAAESYAAIYDGLVRPAVALIRESRFQEAADSYRRFVESLRKQVASDGRRVVAQLASRFHELVESAPPEASFVCREPLVDVVPESAAIFEVAAGPS